MRAFLLLALVFSAATAQAVDLRLSKRLDLAGVVEITNAHDGSGRLFLVQQGGQIRVVRGGQLLATPFIDLGAQITSGGERGLLGLAFAPDFSRSGRFYVYYTATDGAVTIARLRVSADSPDRADAASLEPLLSIPHSQYANHNGGKLAFGADGFLYAGVGDGGGGGDPLGSGQNRNSLLGKLLRIDVSPAKGYAIPPSNPFATTVNAKPEIWDYGLRNPWRFSFDRANGDLYIADVGQDTVEEIDYEPAGSAGARNYGWNLCEGDANYSGSGCATSGLTAPVTTYRHDVGCSVTGGYVYRGGAYPALAGMYLYADYCSGRIWGLTRSGATFSASLLLASGMNISTFGEDEAGNLYLANPGAGVYEISDGAPTRAIGAAYTGTWYDPAQSGHGLMLEVLPDGRLLAYWYTFAPNGGQAWIGGAAKIDGGRAVIVVNQALGGKFIPNFDPAAIERPVWGTLTLTFSDCTTGRVDFDSSLGFGKGSMNLKRLTSVAGAACTDAF
ncbi:MAG: PQQ-dependent sugar dehydrogenase [Proteobacteria bacterium]|nr:PQQ-dependent sugar dehydrogenase [Pseudomonadota bacterium]